MTIDRTQFSDRSGQNSFDIFIKTTLRFFERQKSCLIKTPVTAVCRDSKLRRVVLEYRRLLPVVISTLAILVASHISAQNVFTSTEFNHALNETALDSDLDALNTQISNAVESGIRSNPFADFNFVLDNAGQTKFALTTSDTLGVTFKTGASLDYETTRTFRFRITPTKEGSSTSTLGINTLIVTLNINDVQEKPEVLSAYSGTNGRSLYIQKSPDIGTIPIIFASQVFNDPERAPIQFKLCADDFSIVEHRNPDDQSAAETARGEILTDAEETGTNGTRARHCFNAPATGVEPDPHDVERGGQVVNVTTLGQQIRITPIAADSPGVRKAVLTFRGWAGAPAACGTCTPADLINLSPEAKITVYVKTGINNPPTFGATGYLARIPETTDNVSEITIGPPSVPANAWNATDLDDDELTYRLEGIRSTTCTMADGTAIEGAVAVGRGCAWLVSSTGNVKILGKNIDYETAPPNKTYIITLVASDGYNPATDARVPISIVVTNVDEGLEFSGPVKQISQLVAGRAGRTVDLNDHFTDPDGTPITYTATSSNPSLVSVSLQGSILTVNAVGPAGTTSVVVVATSGGSANPQVIPVSVRETNQPPTFVGGVATVTANRPVSENEPIDSLIRVPGLRYSDPDGDSITATVVNAEPFETVVDPKIGTQTFPGEIALKLTGRLDFETNSRHNVEVQLNDGWDISTRNVNVIVTVVDVNEPPTVTTDAAGNRRTVPDQTVAVNGTGSINLESYFSDPEGGRLIYEAVVTSQPAALSVSVPGVSTVQFQGLQATGNTPAIVTVTVRDTGGLTASLTFRVLVSANNNPQLVRQPVVPALRVGTAVDVSLAGTFTDPDEGDRVQRYEASSNDESIVLTRISPDGLRLTLIPRAEGSTTVVITAIDTRGGRATTNVSVTVIGNSPPTIATPINTVELRPNATSAPIDLNNHFSDQDGDVLTFTATSDQPSFATVSVSGSMLTVRARNRGVARVTVTATDPDGESARTTFIVAVVNDPPSAQAEISVDLEHRGNVDTEDLTTIFTDPDSDAMTFEAMSSDVTVVTVSVQGSTLTVEAIGIGEAEVTVTATDAFGLAGTSTFTVTITNQAPIVAMEIDDQQTDRTMMIMVDLSMVFSDPDGDPLSYSASVTGSQIATATINGSMLEVTTSDIGMTTIEVTATDEFGDSVSTDFDVEVMNLAPTVAAEIANFSLQVGGEPASRDLTGAFDDDDAMPLVITATTVNELVATASVTGMTISITPVSRGGTMAEITATDVHGASVSVNVGISVSDSEIKSVANTALASFSRTVLNSVSSTLGARLVADADGLYTPFAMYSLDDFAPTDEYVVSSNNVMDSSPFGIDNDGWTTNSLHVGASPHQNQYNQLESLFGRGFALKLAAAGDPTFWSLWGGLDSQSFEAADHEGSATSFYFGADMTLQGQWTFGIGIGRTAGDVDYTYGNAEQKMENDLTQVLPYGRYQPSDRTTIYGAFGVGSGTLETTIIGVDSNDRADLKGTLGLFGGRQVMYTAANGLNLAIVGDVGFSNLETDKGDNGAESLLAEVGRIRGGLETSFNMLMGADGSFTPFLTVGFRSDSGDGIADSGVEISGGIRITNPILTLDANFRTLATYGEDDYSESGFAIMALLNPTAGATGLSISLSPSWGASTVHTNALWQDDLQVNRVPDLSSWGIAHNEQVRIDSNIGYGFLVIDERFLLTPFIDVQSGYSNEHDFSIGAKFTQMLRSSHNLDVSVQVGENSSYSGTQEESIKVNARLNF